MISHMDAQYRKERVALLSVVSNTMLVVMKFIVVGFGHLGGNPFQRRSGCRYHCPLFGENLQPAGGR
jgi:hypothetical protein